MRQICPNIYTIELKRPKILDIKNAFSAIVRNNSFIIARDHFNQMADAVKKISNDIKPNIIHIDHLQMAQYVNFIPNTFKFKTVLDNHNVEADIIKRISERSDKLLHKLYASIEWKKLQKYELNICKRSSVVITVSDIDKKRLYSLDNTLKNLQTIPIGVDTEYFGKVKYNPQSNNILHIGTMYWPPNVDSMLYFYKSIYPLIKKQIPESTLTIAGQNPVNEIIKLSEDKSVNVTGYVDDIRTIAENCGVFIVPLRSGSGVRVKILNALAMGLPVVSTSIGAEGIDIEDKKHILLANSNHEFADAVVKLLENKQFAKEIGDAGRKLVQEKYSWDIVGKKLIDLYNNLGN
ncbi:MAG: glycosyltransferase family 4 protein [Armatimonadota bacterium]